MRQINAYSLKSFYNSRKGRIVRSLIRQKIHEIWPEIKSQRLMGYGYAMPYLRLYMGSASRAFNIMPEQLGVHNWPPEAENCVCLAKESVLPLETNSVDFILMVHALEFLDTPEESFEEIWRVLKSTGRLIIVVPNRVGLWARADWSPFGQGRPYSIGQVEDFLSDNLFVHERTSRALFSPPFKSEFLLRGANFFEKVGPYLYPALGGVHVIEASKQLYAGTGKLSRARAKNEGIKKIAPVGAIPTQRIKN